MKTVIDKANTRGYFNHGWLKTYHTFSFADYYNPRRIHFGALRVLNDDTVAPGEGFGMVASGMNVPASAHSCRAG